VPRADWHPVHVGEDNGSGLDESFVRAIQDLNGHAERLPVAAGGFTWAAVWRTVVRMRRADLMSNPWADIEVATGDITDLVRELVGGPGSPPTGIVQANAVVGPSYLMRSTDGSFARPAVRDRYWRASPGATDAARFERVEQVFAFTDDDWSRRLQGLE
jgi:hypothetical protein